VDHFHQFEGSMKENVRAISRRRNRNLQPEDFGDDIILYGTRGNPIKAKTVNSKNWCWR